MLGDWLNLTLDGDVTGEREGRLPGGRYVLHGPGMLELQPAAARPSARTMVISAGIHGDETAPIELVGELLARIESGQLRPGAPVLVLLGNLPAIRAGTRYCATNLNRLFQRDVVLPDNDEGARAATLMATVDDFFARHPGPRLHYDLHTAIRDSRYPRFAVEPFDEAAATADEQWRWLAAAGIQAVLHQHRHSWTFSHYSKHYHAAQAFTLELGKVRPFGTNDLHALRPLLTLLEALVEGREPPGGASPGTMAFFRVAAELIRHARAFRLCFADDTPNFTEFAVGTRLAEDAEAGDFIVEGTPLAVVFPNAEVELGARAALLVRPTEPPETG
ncbi:succinylglutamate desuccinylase [Modicisalibacter coralii]|uniref:succinylglutamate desuccinylase n=1 Tax=Modicisalibacter coralii TaxID=2304602 RepID=UPI00100AD3CE|nr:succinylglutamate desuccinylase [Halomonas coralii]